MVKATIDTRVNPYVDSSAPGGTPPALITGDDNTALFNDFILRRMAQQDAKRSEQVYNTQRIDDAVARTVYGSDSPVPPFAQAVQEDARRNRNPEAVTQPLMGSVGLLERLMDDDYKAAWEIEKEAVNREQGFEGDVAPSYQTQQTIRTATELANPFLDKRVKNKSPEFTTVNSAADRLGSQFLIREVSDNLTEDEMKEASVKNPFADQKVYDETVNTLRLDSQPERKVMLPGTLLTAMTRAYANVRDHTYIKQADPNSIFLEEIGKSSSEYDLAMKQSEMELSTLGRTTRLTRSQRLALKKKGQAAESSAFDVIPDKEGRSSKELLASAVIDYPNQPVMRHFESDMASTIANQMAKADGGETSYVNLPPEQQEQYKYLAARLIQLWANEGYLSFGITKKGYVVPLNTDLNPVKSLANRNSEVDNAKIAKEGKQKELTEQQRKSKLELNADRAKPITDLDRINQLFFNDMRDKTALQVLSEKTPPEANSLRNKETNQVIIGKGRNIKLPKGQTFSSVFQTEMNHVALGINETSFVLQDYFLNEAISDEFIDDRGFSTHPLADTFTEGSQDKWERIARERGEQAAFVETTDKLSGVSRKHRDLLRPRYLDKQSRFSLWSQSASTLRFFPVNIDTNATNGKGDVRPVQNFNNVQRISLTDQSLDSNRIIKLAERTFNPDRRTGRAAGEWVLKKLNSLSESDVQLLDYYFALGEVMMKLGGHKRRPTASNYDPRYAIKYALNPETQTLALRHSKTINALVNQLKVDPSKAGKFKDQDPIIQKIMGEGKGEWSYPATVLAELEKLNTIKANKSGNHKFTYTFEMDATQSNAALMSLYTGSTEIAKILGVLEGEGEYKDLRNMIYANVNQDIDNALSAENDADINQAFHDFFHAINKTSGLNASKIYARGLVVAGLYGKTPQFMYSEAQEMLDQVPDQAKEHLYPLYTAANGDINFDKLQKDIAGIFTSSSVRSMTELNGYQSAMKAIGEIMGMLNVSTEIRSPLGEKMVIAKDNIVPRYMSEKDVSKALRLETKDLGAGMIRGAYRTVRQDVGAPAPSVAAREMLSMAFDKFQGNPHKDYKGRRATQLKNALPVDLIQAGDSAMMLLSTLLASPGGKLPLNIMPVHDAAITTAGSTLKFKTAYDNIAMHDLVARGSDLLVQLEQNMEDDVFELMESVLQMPENAKINIGTQVRVDKGRVSNYSAVTDFFDELFVRSKTQDTFYTEDQLLRPPIQRVKAIMEHKAKETLAAAKANGYISFDNLNAEQAKSYTVSPKEFINLLKISLEHQGLAFEEEAILKGKEIDYRDWKPVTNYTPLTVKLKGRKQIEAEDYSEAMMQGRQHTYETDDAGNIIVLEWEENIPAPKINRTLKLIDKFDRKALGTVIRDKDTGELIDRARAGSLANAMATRESSGFNLKS